MQIIPSDIEIYVHRVIHESLTEELIREYHSKYNYCIKTHVLLSNNYVMCNFRNIHKCGIYGYIFIGGLLWESPTSHYHDNEEPVCLPKRYFFSSGMNSLIGYF